MNADVRARAEAQSNAAETTVTVRCTGRVRDAVGTHELEFTFAGTRLREFLEAYDVEDMLLAETEADATAHGWAPVPDELPGTWRKNPEGEQTDRTRASDQRPVQRTPRGV